MTDFTNKEAVMRVYDVLDKIGVIQKIEKDIAKIMEDEEKDTDFYFEGNDDEIVSPKVIIGEKEIPLNRVMYNLG
jgi:hypothetical protein